ncbi:MAG TPA: prolyl oligopeptidase family serine peptidase [Caulobacteraceae bacterium]|nr:prolyl oligopeptidase family serine peptidase [Caulobacteraceae bacterium]
MTVAPFGAWASPISAESLAKGSIGVGGVRVANKRLYWLENRPDEGGRMVALTGDASGFRTLTPSGFNVRTRVHEYGGAPFLVVGDTLYFANFGDQRLYAQRGDAAPVALTPAGYRYADMAARPGGGLVAVREDHTDPADVKNAIVALSGEPEDAGRVLFGSSDFAAYPRLSRDGRKLAWMAWDHPNMPWDDTALYAADIDGDVLSNIEQVAGGVGESAMEPSWAADGTLYFISDRSGFWNLYARRAGVAEPVLEKHAEFAGPLWGLGQSNYVLMDDGRVVATYGDESGDHLIVIAGRDVREVSTPFSALGGLQRIDEQSVALLAGSGLETGALVTVDLRGGDATVVRRPSPSALPQPFISRAEPITFPSAGDLEVHALFYAPANPDFTAPAGEAPPLIVQAHGGPTGAASSSFSLSNQFWTTRGFAIVDVDYGGSTGYGRAYRQRLNDKWGIVDVEDVIAAVKHLAAQGRIDPKRVAIHGGSAGGFTVLAALSQSDVFRAGASFYGVADLGALARDTHKFESRYLDNLIGPWPAAKAIYDERSPLNHLERFRTPLIIFQGSEDPIVPPNQAHMIRDALRERQQPVAYMEFAGESHGFRRAETLIASKEAELYFYGRVFGFKPAGDLPEIEIENLPR